VLRLERDRWTIVSTCAERDMVRLGPFEAIELDLSVL
jgi:hypothetical protein